MANTLSVMIRNVVSKKRRRYQEGGFDLDLAYICDNIIAMGYPGEYIQGVFRNRMNDVCHFFEVTHPEHYKVYNLRSEKAYDVNKFHGRVSVYAFEDHNPPTIELIEKFCNDVGRWLNKDPNNVAAIHCKAGKGRTGTMICCYLLYSGVETTAEDALALYDERRTMNKKGVTIPSQRRYVHYYARLIRSKLKYERRILQLCGIRFSHANALLSQGSVQCVISTMEEIDCSETRTSKVHDIDSAGSWTKVTVKELDRFTIDFRKTFNLELDDQRVFVTGDVKVELKKLFHFWFNSYFVCDTAAYEGEGEDMKLIYTLSKWELDDAHKDKEHKLFSEDFKVHLVLKPIHPHNNVDVSDTTQLRQHNIHNNHVNSLTHNSLNNADMLLNQQLNHSGAAIPTSSKSGDVNVDMYHALNQNRLERNRKPTSLQQLSQMQKLMHRNHLQQQQQQQIKRSSEPTPSVNPESINRSNNKNHNNRSHHQQQQQAQPQQQHTHHHLHHQHHLLHEQQLQQQQQQQQQQVLQHQVQSQPNTTSSSNILNTSSNSNSSSSSSISSQSSSSSSSAGVGGGGGGAEEDWESGESSTTTKTTSTTTTTTTTPTTTSLILKNRLISSQNDDDDDNSHKIDKHIDDGSTNKLSTTIATISTMPITTPIITTTTSGAITKSIDSDVDPLPLVSVGDNDENMPQITCPPLPFPPPPPCSSSNGLGQGYTNTSTSLYTKSRHMNFFHKKFHEPSFNDTINHNALETTKCTTARSKFLKLINSQRFKAKTLNQAMGSALALNSLTACAVTQNQLLKKKKAKSKQIPPSKTFQWLHSYFRTDPDFHENLSQQTTIPMGRRNSAGSISSRNHLNSVSSASGIGLGIGLGGRAGSAEKGGCAADVDEVDCHFVGLSRKVDLMEYHITVPPPEKKLGNSPVDKALRNVVDVGIQLSAVSPTTKREFTYESDSEQSNALAAAAILTKNHFCCTPIAAFSSNSDDKSHTLPRVALEQVPSEPPSNEQIASLGSSTNSTSMDHLCLPYSNMFLLSHATLEDAEVYHDHDDYYSSICDNQLSFNNSPCKSPRSLSDIIDLKTAITHRNLLLKTDGSTRVSPSAKLTATPESALAVASCSCSKNVTSSDGIVIAKPVESHSIGFNVGRAIDPTTPSTPPPSTPSSLPPSTPQTTVKYNMDTDCDDASFNVKARRKTSSDSILNLIIIKSDHHPVIAADGQVVVDDSSGGAGDFGDDTSSTTTDCGTTKAASSSSSSGYCCASEEGSSSISSCMVDTISSSVTTFSLERNNSDDGGGGSGVVNSKKKFSLPTPEIEVNEIGMTKNRSSSVSNNNNNHSNIRPFLASSSSSSSSSGSSIDNNDKQ